MAGFASFVWINCYCKNTIFSWRTWGFLLLLRLHALILPAALRQTPSDGRAPTLSRYPHHWTCRMDPGSCGGNRRTAPDPAGGGGRLGKSTVWPTKGCLESVGSTCGMIVSLPLRSCKPIVEISMSSIRILPSAASIILKRQLVRLDFPAPVRPTIPIWNQWQIKKWQGCLTITCTVHTYVRCQRCVWTCCMKKFNGPKTVFCAVLKAFN